MPCVWSSRAAYKRVCMSVGAKLRGTGNRGRAGLPVWKSSFHLDPRAGSIEDICTARGKSFFAPFPPQFTLSWKNS